VVLEGNRGRRPINRLEPKPRQFRQKPPEYLDAAAQKEWARLVPILKRMRVLTEADYIALANLCQATSTLAKAQDQLNKAGLLLKTKSGYVQQSPLLAIVNGSTEIVLKHLREFGLTPSSRSRLQISSDQREEPDELLNGNWGT